MRFGSLFAGVGGFDIGLEAAGWECGWQVEWDKNCQQTLAYHWPDVPKWWDVSDVNGAELPVVDVITFGSPCQDLSVAGKRAGIQQEGGRSNLFFEATRIIKEMRDATGNTFPRWAIWENVPGAFTSGAGDDFEAVLKEMANLGASLLEWATLDAQFFGVPQRRRRVFVLACFDTAISDRGGRQILAISEGSRRNTSKGKQARQNVTAETTGSVGTSSWPAGTTVDGDVLRTSVTSKWSKGTSGPSGSEYYNLVVENPIVGSLQARDYKGVGNQYVMENKLVVHETSTSEE
jgi:DNA (cytosine-5)-methyltransferase 1